MATFRTHPAKAQRHGRLLLGCERHRGRGGDVSLGMLYGNASSTETDVDRGYRLLLNKDGGQVEMEPVGFSSSSYLYELQIVELQLDQDFFDGVEYDCSLNGCPHL